MLYDDVVLLGFPFVVSNNNDIVVGTMLRR